MEAFNQEEYNHLYKCVIDLLSQSLPSDLIEIELKKISSDAILIAVAMKEGRKDYYAAMRKDGLAKISIGAIFIVVGFLITCFNFHSDKSFSFAMYGLTSIGIVFVFWGLYKLIG